MGILTNCTDHPFVFYSCDEESLYDYVYIHGKLPEQEVKEITSMILSGLRCCHENNVTHRSIKVKNCLDDSVAVHLG